MCGESERQSGRGRQSWRVREKENEREIGKCIYMYIQREKETERERV